ncbi:MAG: hypothetical protein ABI467_15400 [Kofleriaceae bacterium]
MGQITITVAFPFPCTATITGGDHVDDHDHVDGAWIRNRSSEQPMATTAA